MNLIRLKDEYFKMWNDHNPTILLKRWISDDFKFCITQDNESHVKVYIANKDKTGDLCHDIYHQGNMHAYPIYTVEDAIEKIEKMGINTEYTMDVDKSQYK